MGLSVFDSLLNIEKSKKITRRLIGLIAIGGRAKGLLELDEENSNKPNDQSVHLKWGIETTWNYPAKGFALYRRPYETNKNRDRKNLLVKRPSFFELLRTFVVSIFFKLLAMLGNQRATRVLKIKKYQYRKKYQTLRFPELAREIELTFKPYILGSDLVESVLKAYDQDNLSISKNLQIDLSQKLKIATVASKVFIEKGLERLTEVTYTPVAADILQWPEGTLNSWGTPIANFNLPKVEQYQEFYHIITRHNIETGLPDVALRKAYIELITRLELLNYQNFNLINLDTQDLQTAVGELTWGQDQEDQIRIHAIDVLQLISTHRELGKFFGFYYQDDLSANKDYPLFDYLIVADWGHGLLTSSPEYRMNADQHWDLKSPLIENIKQTSHITPTPFPADLNGVGQQILLELSIVSYKDIPHKQRATQCFTFKNDRMIGEGEATPVSPNTLSYFDNVSVDGQFSYKVKGRDCFGRFSEYSPEVVANIDPTLLPKPSSPLRVSASYLEGLQGSQSVFEISFIWTQELRDLFPLVESFKAVIGPSDNFSNTYASNQNAMIQAHSVTIVDSTTSFLEGVMTGQPTLIALSELDDKVAERIREDMNTVTGEDGLVPVVLSTSFEISDSMIGIMRLPEAKISIQVLYNGQWLLLPIIDHTIGENVSITVASRSDINWRRIDSDNKVRLIVLQNSLTVIKSLTGSLNSISLTGGTLGDQSGRSFIILASDNSGKILVLNRTAGNALLPDPQNGAGTIVSTQSIFINSDLVPHPTESQPEQQLACRVVTLDSRGREGIFSHPVNISRIYNSPAPNVLRPSASLKTLPNKDQKAKVLVEWESIGENFGYEISRISLPEIKAYLNKEVLAGVSAQSLDSKSEVELLDLLNPNNAANEDYHFEQAFKYVGAVTIGVQNFVDTIDSAKTQYFYAIRARDKVGNRGKLSAASNSVVAPSIKPPNAPDNILAYNDLAGIARVSWAPSHDEHVSNYRLYGARNGQNISSRLMTLISSGADVVAESLTIRDGRICYSPPQQQAVLEHIRILEQNAHFESSVDLNDEAVISGNELKHIWANGQAVVLEIVRTDSVIEILGDDQTFIINVQSIDISNIDSSHSIIGVYLHKMADIGSAGIANKADIPNLLEHAYISSQSRTIYSIYSNRTKWVIELTSRTQTTNSHFLEYLEYDQKKYIQNMGENIALPFWNDVDYELTGLYLFSNFNRGSEGILQKRVNAINYFDRFKYVYSQNKLTQRWCEGARVQLEFTLPDGTAQSTATHSKRLSLTLQSQGTSRHDRFFLQAGRREGDVTIWSKLSTSISVIAQIPEPTLVLRELSWVESVANIKHSLIFSISGELKFFYIARKFVDGSEWKVQTVLMLTENGVFEKDIENDSWITSQHWSLNQGVISGQLTAESEVNYDYQLTAKKNEDSPSLITSTKASIFALYEAEM